MADTSTRKDRDAVFDFGLLDVRYEPMLWGWWVTVRARPRPFNICCGTDGVPRWGFAPPFEMP